MNLMLAILAWIIVLYYVTTDHYVKLMLVQMLMLVNKSLVCHFYSQYHVVNKGISF